MCIRITLESGCCCHIQLPAGQGDKGSRKDGYVVELAMCELLANASRIVTKRSNSPSLAQLCFVRIMSSITLHKDGCQYGYGYSYMYMHMCLILGVLCCRFEKLVQGERSQRSSWEKDNGSTKTIGHVRCFLDSRYISGQKMVPAFESLNSSKGPATDVAHMSGVVSAISLNGRLHFNIKSHRPSFIQYNRCNLAQ